MIKFSKTNLNTNSEEKIPFTIKILQTLKLKQTQFCVKLCQKMRNSYIYK